MPLLPGGGGMPPPPALLGGPPTGPPGMGGPPPGLGDPSAGPPGLPGLGGGPPGMGGPQFPSIDPAQVAGALGGVRQLQLQDQQSLQDQQHQVLSMLADAMSAAPNPAAQAAQTAPGYPTPPEEGM